MAYSNIAYEILQQEGRPLHYKKITELAQERDLIKTDSPTPHDSLRAQISIEIKKEGAKSRFVKTAKGTYGLRDYSPRPPPPPPGNTTPSGRPSKRRKGPDFMGPGGELLVQSELLFREYEASKPVPDIGIDIMARKGGKTFYIQVKTRNMAEGPYSYEIKKRSFDRTPKQGTYYVFVMRNPRTGSSDFIVLPRADMAAMIKNGTIRPTNKQPASYQVLLTLKAGAVKCKGHNMMQYKNNWAIT